VTRVSGLVKGGGVSSIASTTAKIEAPAPSVYDSVRIAAVALAGERRRFRRRWRRSTNMVLTPYSLSVSRAAGCG
jgi:hypothetical protein